MECFATSAVTGLHYYTSNIPQSGSNQYLFDEIEIPSGTISEEAWYTLFIPQNSIGDSTKRMNTIDFGNSNTYGTSYTLGSTIYNYGLVTYSGSVFQNTDYRVYTTWTATSLRKDNTSQPLFFKGGSVSLKK